MYYCFLHTIETPRHYAIHISFSKSLSLCFATTTTAKCYYQPYELYIYLDLLLKNKQPNNNNHIFPNLHLTKMCFKDYISSEVNPPPPFSTFQTQP